MNCLVLNEKFCNFIDSHCYKIVVSIKFEINLKMCIKIYLVIIILYTAKYKYSLLNILQFLRKEI